MAGTGFAISTAYRVVFWDQEDSTWYDRETEDTTSDGSGNLSAAHTFAAGTDTQGNWHCTVYTSGADPSTYNSNDSNLIADDTSYTGDVAFYVEASAIPEFPMVLAAIGVVGLCFVIYWWMRRNRLRGLVRSQHLLTTAESEDVKA